MTVVCLGDSLTYGYEVRRAAAWTTRAAAMTGETILNKGINGLMTAGMLTNFTRDVIGENADAVLLMGGANDILAGLTPDVPISSMRAMIERARAAGIRPLLGISVPFCPPIRDDWAAMADFPARTPVYEEYTRRLYTLATETETATVDFRAGLAERVRKNGENPRALYIDGIHLNETGHALFAEIFVRALRAFGVIPHDQS